MQCLLVVNEIGNLLLGLDLDRRSTRVNKFVYFVDLLARSRSTRKSPTSLKREHSLTDFEDPLLF